MCLALHCRILSLSSPAGGEGGGEEATSPGEARPPPSPTLPPLVPRGERETCVEYAKHIRVRPACRATSFCGAGRGPGLKCCRPHALTRRDLWRYVLIAGHCRPAVWLRKLSYGRWRREWMKTPNTKLQTPEKFQITSSKAAKSRAELVFGAWEFFGVWSLVFGV